MTYNLTQLQDAEKVSQLFLFANSTTGGVLASGLMIAIFFVLLIVMKRYEFTHSFVTASFICFILSSLAAYAGWSNLYVVLAFLTLTAFTLLFMYIKQE